VINAVRSPVAPPSLAAGTKYNGRDVVDTLLRDFLGKCYLCEIHITVREHSVDHRRPRAQFPELVCAWANLFPSCRDCNERRPKIPSGGLLDPTRDDVEARLAQTTQVNAGGTAEVPWFAAREPADALAVATAAELNHLHNSRSVKAAELRSAITARIDEVLQHILDFHTHGSSTRGPVRTVWEEPLRHDFSRRAPFTALVRGRLGAGLESLFD
jgi:hypothetical protein